MGQTTVFLHQGSIGDCWASIPAMKEYYRKTNKKITLYLVNGIKAFYYDNAIHPTVNSSGEQVMLNETVINMMIPLFKAQPFIADCKVWSNQPVHVDLGKIRETDVNMPYGDLRKWYFYVYPDTQCDVSKPYIEVPDTDKDFAKGKIIVTRSERYLNPLIKYHFMKRYEEDILFVGTDLEYQIFQLRYGLHVGHLKINDFLELAQALKQCKFHVSNQTQAFQISEGLKIPRILEVCRFAPNVEPIGENGYGFYAQEALEYYVAVLNGETLKAQQGGLPVVINLPKSLGVK